MHVLITGASSGIGEELARQWSRAGADVSLLARRRELLDQLAQGLGGRSHVVAADLGDPAAAVRAVQEAEAALGPVDVLVNNAGVQHIEPTAQLQCERGEALLRLNVFTPLRLIGHVLPGMIERGRGTLVNVSSMAALAPTAGMTYYNASKGGLAASSEALRGELRRTGVNVVTVYPGIILTAMGEAGLRRYRESAALRLQPYGTTVVLAQKTLAAVERRRARVIYPTVYWLARWFPGVTRFMMDRMTPEILPAEH